ncbi:MAG: NADH-quinone oxidoreductase subunit L [Ilumatobacter sp.]|jgi:NADH-quinone oxidoreductase subunit L|uniref:NADH-quinone oxidoreductase subunit L n=1 Tax=Ilumatobacter sp. TaxID=1967498 RepID=UPI001E0BB204|nr:NADH-quinone oxidoreductase subunit L [Ilumatobacter sp.]MBT5276857.1 NADH-quinone oxidoreductase subunit L [Ilumatobacter sp.]MBT5554252.1 NADH-quinone oxidoreductase subunit L [Ilumatobacter sp.]MBT5867135.1 NADH-quinone oxidoreductase subunit L [Ilumatobacter sp.]MDG0977363.1 NADH-quinone oxidoreductase subunit L [Ilumatobacter sp.]
MIDLVWLVPLFPLVGFLTILVGGRKLGEPKAGYLATAMVLLSFATAVAIYFDLLSRDSESRSEVVNIFSWVPVGDLQIDMAFLVDPLSSTMLLFVTGIGALIHLYSVGYMHGDPKFSKFFLYLNLFVLSMTLLVLGSNLLVTFLGWEGVGTCSYFLISFWQTKDANATAGKKAFVTNRVGDFGVMLAMFLAFGAVGSVDYAVINDSALAGTMTQATATGIAALLFVGAVGKSAQLPLYIWLPDAMAGPTPVSALIHAATMVTAGVFLMVRINPVLGAAADWVPMLIAWTGAITALFAATIALTQNDIKKVLAYSTVSQLGYMFLAVGTGAYVAAIFHMVTHAFFKALLFLGSGSVIHGMNDEQDMRKMGKLFKFMPITASTFIIGWLAIAGVPPFAGFWSKDEILLFALAESPALYIVGIVTAILTAFYMTRQVVMTFFGEQKWGSHANAEEAAHLEVDDAEAGAAPEPVTHGAHGEFKPHESPPTMLLPLVVLAGLSMVGGIIQLPSLGFIPKSMQHKLLDWLHPLVEFGEGPEERGIGEAVIKDTWAYDNKVLLIGIAVACAVIGIVGAYLVYEKKRMKPIEPELFANGWNYDRAISWFMGNPGRKGFQGVADFDSKVVDGAVNGVATLVRETSSQVRKGQTGYLRQYAGVIGIGVVLLLGWFVVIRGIL